MKQRKFIRKIVLYISPSAGISATLSAALTGNALTVPKEIGVSYYSCLKFLLIFVTRCSSRRRKMFDNRSLGQGTE